jgi:4-hydroxy-tetrahydrodipicolinate reductase
VIKIGVLGAAGRMGQMLIRQVNRTPGVILIGASERAGAAAIGEDAGELAGIGTIGVSVTDHATSVIADADVVIDFTSSAATAIHAVLASSNGTALVIGTTGLDEEAHEAIAVAALSVPVVVAANFSAGVVVLQSLVEQAARALGDISDIEIVEMHHSQKVDAPSGTALALGEAAAKGRDVALGEVAVRGRDGITGARAKGAIGFASLRGGDVVGDHTVILASAGERLELTHRASSREIFAQGAVRAALWIAGRSPGRYGMADVLGLSE